MRQRGWQAETQIGQSRFRCDVAVRTSGAAQHQVGILLDITGNTGVLERLHTQPSILKAFGWQTLVILAKDWWHDPQSVTERIERLLRNEAADEAETSEELEPPILEPEIAVEPPIVSPQPSPLASTPSSMKRFEFVEGGSKKFWEIGQSGCEMNVRYGRIGTNGQTQTKCFPDEARAAREVQKLTAEKVKKGYTEVS